VKETMQYTIELKIDDQTYTLTGPAYAPVHALYDAASQFFLIMKNKMDKVNEKLEEEAKKASEKEDKEQPDIVEAVEEKN